ncbi:MAG: hypothetical protein MPN21_02650 [Thermoanaerobaculia bacterium]|nr:hypothetical protein [Thermoanaerobaculia bacterium]
MDDTEYVEAQVFHADVKVRQSRQAVRAHLTKAKRLTGLDHFVGVGL